MVYTQAIKRICESNISKNYHHHHSKTLEYPINEENEEDENDDRDKDDKPTG